MRGSIGSRVLAGALVVVSVTLAAFWFLRQPRHEPSLSPSEIVQVIQGTDDPSLRLGLRVYADKCAPCHGAQGRGDGPAAYLLYPKARDFSSGQFRLTSTQSGLPSDADLLRTLKRGIPGSSMPPWGYLPDSTLQALISAIRFLAAEGRAATLMESGGMPREQALAAARDVLSPGSPVDVPARPDTGVSLALGKHLYGTACSPCHDLDGRGLKKQDLKDDDGYPIFARDFTQGVFKGGSEPEVLALRVVRGLPGSPMPGIPYSAAETWSIVDYLTTLIKPGAQARAEQSQRTLQPNFIAAPVPRDPGDPQWQREGVFLPVTPLWWRNDRIEGVNVTVLRSSEEIGIRLEWTDTTANVEQLSQRSFSDGAAIQFSNAPDPPSFTMGSAGQECDIWYWRASTDPLIAQSASPSEVSRSEFNSDHQLSDEIADEAVFQTALAAQNPVAVAGHSIQNLQASGFGTLGPDGPGDQVIEGAAGRTSSGWAVVFIRGLQPPHPGDVVFDPSRPMHISFAVWDGHNLDRNGQKSMTIWHRLGW